MCFVFHSPNHWRVAAPWILSFDYYPLLTALQHPLSRWNESTFQASNRLCLSLNNFTSFPFAGTYISLSTANSSYVALATPPVLTAAYNASVSWTFTPIGGPFNNDYSAITIASRVQGPLAGTLVGLTWAVMSTSTTLCGTAVATLTPQPAAYGVNLTSTWILGPGLASPQCSGATLDWYHDAFCPDANGVSPLCVGATPSPSPTGSNAPTGSATSSSTTTLTGTITPTLSATSTFILSPLTPSTTGSPAVPQSLSGSPSHSPTAAASNSRGATPSQTATATSTTSNTASPTHTASVSATATLSPSWSETKSRTISGTQVPGVAVNATAS